MSALVSEHPPSSPIGLGDAKGRECPFLGSGCGRRGYLALLIVPSPFIIITLGLPTHDIPTSPFEIGKMERFINFSIL